LVDTGANALLIDPEEDKGGVFRGSLGWDCGRYSPQSAIVTVSFQILDSDFAG
jgi:hypothetical protein